MAVEDSTDRAVFFDAGDFAVEAFYNGTGCQVLSSTPDTFGTLQTVGLRLTAAAQAAARIVLVRKDQVAAPAVGAVLSIGSDDYPVREVIALDDGEIWQLALDKPT